MSTLRTPSTRPTAFWVGLGVPLAIVLVAAWQWYRAAHWRLDVASGHDAGPYLGPLALVTLLLGMTAIATFCLALLGMRRAASHALLSRDALVEAFNRGRRWLPAFMVAQTLLVFGSDLGHSDHPTVEAGITGWLDRTASDLGASVVEQITQTNGRGLLSA